MKKTIVITSMALCLSFVTVNAKVSSSFSNSFIETIIPKVSPFCISIAKGDIETVKKLIELGSDVNQKSNGMTPIMYAAKFNRTDILKLLISKGAKLNMKSDTGKTALDYAKLHKATDAAVILEDALSKD
ncbi:hypothetical protein APS56_06385 [Pseudalgibacter alginicilyticus]|uniref:Uncharacterized protein n=1 Tax=Pseudalgibacter alginicilyticus TaxID=1736674 RepID=A0A0P0CWA6_9FLAO|nr:ankyrin repeat domain-containing protein [Pseudalgibacter alginicilyticus]ALJ04773.1 hypothetical protein APS56_06385 [Pseudalgibacter alginicilyticus]